MSKLNSIHEMNWDWLYWINDLVDNGLGSKKGLKKRKAGDNYMTKSTSISRATSGLTAVFPTIVSESVSGKSAAMINKALERNHVSMLNMAFSAYNITNCTDAVEYVQQFHKNMNLDIFMDTMDSGINLYKDGFFEGSISHVELEEMIKAVQEDCRCNIDFYFEDDINESSLNNYKVFNRYGNQYIAKTVVKESDEDFNKGYKSGYADGEQDTLDLANDPELYKSAKNKTSMEKDRSGTERDKSAIQKDKLDMQKMNIEIITKRLLSTDVKKANELVPSMMIINIHSIDDAGNPVVMQAVLGVKAKMYSVPSEMTLSKLVRKNADSNVILQLVRASTREISFFKDFLFAIDNAKLDSLQKSKKGSASKLFKALERRSLNGKIRKLAGKNIDTKAISSLVISMEEAEYLLKYNNVDVLRPNVIKPIMEKLNLLYFIIVDETNENVRLLIDGDQEYEILSFSHLEREANDGEYKKVVNLMSKMNR